MRHLSTTFCIAILVTFGCKPAATPPADAIPKPVPAAPILNALSTVETVLENFHRDIRSDDEPTRLKAISLTEPNSSNFELLFGSDDGAVFWSKYKVFVKELRDNNQLVKAEMERGGEFISVEANEVLLAESNLYFQNNPQKVPEGVRAFEESVTTERGGAGSGTYYLIEGKVVFIRTIDLNSIVRDLEKP